MLKLIVDILSVPAILVGLISLIGLLCQKKNFSDTVKGTIKTILGFIVLTGGAGILTNGLVPFGQMFEVGFKVQGIVPNNEAIVALAIAKYGTVTALIMAFGMLANILIARFTKLKYIFLTGHHTFYMACMIAVILAVAGFQGAMLVFVGSVVLGFSMAFFPALAHPTMKKITGTDDVAFGHFGTVGYVLAAKIGALVGKGSKSTEEMNLPKNLSFLRDSSISISLTMLVLYLITSFAAGVFVVLQGVRLILAEIVPAFTGISQTLVPNAKPAIDCPVVFPYAPNAVLIGFLCSFLGGIVGLFILGVLNWVLIIPGVIPHFFCGATAGVFANATGGRRGAAVGSFIHGVFITFVPVVLLPILGELGFANTTFSDADFGVVGALLGVLAGNFNKYIILVVFAVFILLAFIFPRNQKKEN